MINLDLTPFPPTSNSELSVLNRPYRMTLAEFHALPVSEQEQELRGLIYELETSMHGIPGAITDTEANILFPPIHRHTRGIYSRELTIPKGFIVVGKRHGQEHIVMLIEGECLVATERGVEHLKAPWTFISPAGEKRVVYATEQVTWVTIHRTDAVELDEIENDIILSEPERALAHKRIREGVISCQSGV